MDLGLFLSAGISQLWRQRLSRLVIICAAGGDADGIQDAVSGFGILIFHRANWERSRPGEESIWFRTGNKGLRHMQTWPPSSPNIPQSLTRTSCPQP